MNVFTATTKASGPAARGSEGSGASLLPAGGFAGILSQIMQESGISPLSLAQGDVLADAAGDSGPLLEGVSEDELHPDAPTDEAPLVAQLEPSALPAVMGTGEAAIVSALFASERAVRSDVRMPRVDGEALVPERADPLDGPREKTLGPSGFTSNASKSGSDSARPERLPSTVFSQAQAIEARFSREPAESTVKREGVAPESSTPARADSQDSSPSSLTASRTLDVPAPTSWAQAIERARVTQPSQTPVPMQASVDEPVANVQAWSKAMAKHVVVMMRDGVAEAVVKINPERLGPVDIRVGMGMGKVDVEFSSPYQEVREVLHSSIKTLDGAMSEAGIVLSKVEVKDPMASFSAQNEFNKNQNKGQSQQQEQRRGDERRGSGFYLAEEEAEG